MASTPMNFDTWNRSHQGMERPPLWASRYDGHKWTFFCQNPANDPAILVLNGTDPACVRSPKMARVESVLFVADAAMSVRKLVQFATLADAHEAKQIVDQLNLAYVQSNSSFRIEKVATGYRLLTQPQFAFWLGKLHQRQAELKLSPPALETLAIVAYRQPMTRAEIETIRRVQCSEMLKQLMERGLVRIAGEDDSLGRPFLYETTRQFLELFGLRGLDALPMADSLRKTKPAISVADEPDEVDGDEATESAA